MLTQEQADEYKAWLDAAPEGLPGGFGPQGFGFGDRRGSFFFREYNGGGFGFERHSFGHGGGGSGGPTPVALRARASNDGCGAGRLSPCCTALLGAS